MLRYKEMKWDGYSNGVSFRAPRLWGANEFEFIDVKTAKELVLKFKDMSPSVMIMLHGCWDPHNFKKELLRLEREIIDATLDGKI